MNFRPISTDMLMTWVYPTPISNRALQVLNGKVERSHGTDEQEVYQILSYTGDVDLHQKLAEWENFYNFHRSHSSLEGKTPYEVLREKMA